MRKILLLVCATLLTAQVGAQQPQDPVVRYGDRVHPEFGASGMVAAQNRLSAAVGAEVCQSVCLVSGGEGRKGEDGVEGESPAVSALHCHHEGGEGREGGHGGKGDG